LRAE
jgi:hypothetical protein